MIDANSTKNVVVALGFSILMLIGDVTAATDNSQGSLCTPYGVCSIQSTEPAAPVESSLAGFTSHLFDTSSYPARWNCGQWSAFEGWLHILSDIGIFVAYFGIPMSLLYFNRRRRDIPFNGIFFLFAAFILFCGAGHLLEAIIFYYPIYRVAGVLKLATAIVSLVTLGVLFKLIPKALELPGLVTKNEMLRQADATKSEFLANMSHEIRTPLTAILGFSEVLQTDDVTPQEKANAVQTIHRNGTHLLALINDILDLSKVEAGRLELEARPTNPRRVVDEVVELLAERAKSRNQELVVEFSGEIPECVTTDPTRLKQALVNLVGNAIKFTEEGSVEIGVWYDFAESHLVYEVRDSGIGMTKEEISRIFRPFGQADSSVTRKYGGTGLGLTITRTIAQLLGGNVSVSSEPGTGSRFRFWVTAETVAQPPAAFVEEQKKFTAESGDVTPGRVLLVEDGQDNQRLISFMLRKADFEVDIVNNGREGFEIALENWELGTPYDVILMDMQMPVMDGYTATRKLRDADYPGHIVAITAHAMKGAESECQNSGCDGYLTKPINRSAMVEEVRRRVDYTLLAFVVCVARSMNVFAEGPSSCFELL